MKRIVAIVALSAVMLVSSVVRSEFKDAGFINVGAFVADPLAVTSVTFSPDGKLLVSGHDEALITVFVNGTGTRLRTLRGHDRSISIVKSNTPAITANSINSLVFTPDGKTLASGGQDKIVLWDTTKWEKLKNLEEDNVNSLAFSPDGKILASGGTRISLWDVTGWAKLRELRGRFGMITSVVFSHDGKWLATGSADRTITIWDTQTWNKAYTLDARSRAVHSIDISPDGKTLASGGNYPNIVLWDLPNKLLLKLVPTLQRSTVISVKFSPDGKTLASLYQNGYVDFWDIKPGGMRKQLPYGRNLINSIAFSQDGKMFASGDSGGKITLWNVDTP